MKLNKKSKLLLTTSFVVTSLLGALVIVHTAVQILNGMPVAGGRVQKCNRNYGYGQLLAQ